MPRCRFPGWCSELGQGPAAAALGDRHSPSATDSFELLMPMVTECPRASTAPCKLATRAGEGGCRAPRPFRCRGDAQNR